MKEEPAVRTSEDTTTMDELDGLWEDLDDDELDDLEPPGPGLMIPLANENKQ